MHRPQKLPPVAEPGFALLIEPLVTEVHPLLVLMLFLVFLDHLGQGLPQSVAAQGFEQIAGYAVFHAALGVAELRVAGEQDGDGREVFPAQPLQKGKAVLSGHFDVGDQKVDGLAQEDVLRFGYTVAAENPVNVQLKLLNLPLEALHNIAVVIHNQKIHSVTSNGSRIDTRAPPVSRLDRVMPARSP